MKRNATSVSAWLISIIIAAFSCSNNDIATSGLSQELPEKVDFNFHIKPILSDRCFKCHGPDEKTRVTNLRLDTEEGAFAAIDSIQQHFALVPGVLSKSELYKRITTSDPTEVMPPPNSNLSLSDYEIALIKKWIEEGAEWKKHWSFIPPEQPEPPKVDLAEWPVNEIDQFVLAKLTEKGVRPSEPATKAKLLRRLSFDLRGLPPTLEELDQFLNDDRPDAYESWVDRFLSEQTFGERLAMDWLDLARYADSHGYQDDIERSMWPWRDWVIDAFNQNMPYDQFVTWQLAGDLLPDANYEQKLATGFNRNHKITQEVGVIEEEYRVTYVLDRVNTFSTALLGMTVECAQCHDHKYDPVSQEEYYQLFAFFNQVPEKGRVDYGVEVAEPSLPLPEEKVQAVQAYIDQIYDGQFQEVDAYIEKQWEEAKSMALEAKTSGGEANMPSGLSAWFPLDYWEDFRSKEANGNSQAISKRHAIPVPGKFGGGLEFMGKNYVALETQKTLNLNGPFSISFWINSLDDGISGMVFSGFAQRKRLPNLQVFVSGVKRLNVVLDTGKKGNRIHFKGKSTVPANRWTHVCIRYDGRREVEGIEVFFDGKPIDAYRYGDPIKSAFPPLSEFYLATGNPWNAKARGLNSGQLDELMWFNKALSFDEIRDLGDFDPIKDLQQQSRLTSNDQQRLFAHHLHHFDPRFKEMTDRLREYRIRQGRTKDIVVKPTMVMADMDTVRPTYVLDRGQYDAPTKQVFPGTPAAILPFQQELPENRLGLAKWLFSPDNPLTARVAVNRYWQMIFGKGIVATPGDFGSQGTLPTHPELLDYLAVDFMTTGWDVKALLKKMVMSATYRQSANNSEELLRLDPDNIYLARGAQSRLSAEMVRDHALSVSGVITNKIGGPSVKPYQPAGLWLQVASGNQTLRKYIQGHGQDLYRRSLYTFWKRTVPPPSMLLFDAPTREQCTIQRTSTSTPMQALVLLNDPQFNEASRLLAANMMAASTDHRERIINAFRVATSRLPSEEELGVLLDLFETESGYFDANLAAAEAFVSIGEYPLPTNYELSELAAYTVVASAILNLTETIMKG